MGRAAEWAWYGTRVRALELFSYKWPIFPNVTFVPLTQNPLLWARNLVLPRVTLAFLYAALYARLTQAGCRSLPIGKASWPVRYFPAATQR